MSAKLDNAIGLYMEGIRDGRAAAASDKYIGDRYILHSTGVADGKEGFLPSSSRFWRHIPTGISGPAHLRGWPIVFAHVYQSLDGGTAR